MKACITGGAGFIGRTLVQHLQNEGMQLRLLSRGKSTKVADENYFIADLTDRTVSLDGFFDEMDVIYHCAGEIENEAVMHSLHVDGTAKLLRAAKAHINTTHKPLHWVQLSSVGAYGPPQGRADMERVVLETTLTAPEGEYEVTKTLADEMVIQFARTEPLFTYTILRPSNVIGKNMTNQSVRSLIKIIKKKMFFYIGSTLAMATYIHVDDVVDALILCGKDVRARGQIFNLSNDCMLSEIVDAVAKNADIKTPALCIPERPVRLLAKFFSLLGKTPLTQDRINALMKRTSYPNQKIKEMLLFTPRHAIPITIATLLDDMRKKICIVATVPFALQTYMRAHIVMLAEQNEVTLITSGSERDLQGMSGEHVDFIHLNVVRKVSLFTDLQALIRLVLIFRKNRFDVVHSIMPKTGLLAMLAAYVASIPYRIHTFTGQVWANKVGLPRWGLKAMDKLIAFCATGLLTDSFSQRAFLIEQDIVPDQKILVLGNGSICGVDVLRFQFNDRIRKARRAELEIPENDVVFLFLGRINPDKGVQDLAHAFVKVNKELPHTRLLVVGPDEGCMDPILQTILAPCASHFHRIGFTEKPEEYMSCADVFCLPSYREGFGSVIIEAAAAGLPAVVSDIYGLTDAVRNGETGIKHEVKNGQQIQDALLLLATDDVLRYSLSTQAYKRAHTYFSQDIVVDEMRRYYHALFNMR